MKIVKDLPAYLLGLVFFLFGLAYFLHLMPEQPMAGDSGTYVGLLASTGYLSVVKALEVLCGLLLLIPKTRALGYILVAPIIVNIALFEICIAKQPGIGIVMILINAVGIYLNREKYMSIIS